MQATSFSPPLCARLAIFRCTVRENDIYSFICYLPPLDLTPFRRMSLYRGGTSGTTLKKLSVFHGLRNYLSLTPRSHLIPHLRANLRSSFNVYRRPSVSSITPSLELGPRFSAPLVLFFCSFCFNYAHGARGKGLNVKVDLRRAGEGERGGRAWDSVPVCAFSRRIENAATGTSVKRAFVVNMFYVRFLLYRSSSARVKCQKISDSLIMRARSLDLERSF